MQESEVNRLIRSEVDDIEDANIKKFLREILAFERQNMDLERPNYKDRFESLTEEYAPEKPEESEVDN